MLFSSSTFIKNYSSTDKFLSIVFPNGDRYYTINVCQRKKLLVNKNTIEIWSEGNLSKVIPFISILEAREAFDLLNQALDSLSPNCLLEITNPPAAVFSIVPITYATYKTMQDANTLAPLQFYDVTDTANSLGKGSNFVYRLLAQKGNDYLPSGLCLNTLANVVINTKDNTFTLYQEGVGNYIAQNNSRTNGLNNSSYLFTTNNSTINADASSYIIAQNNSIIECVNSNNIRVYDNTEVNLDSCVNCEFTGIVNSNILIGYEDVVIDNRSTIGKAGLTTQNSSGSITLVAYQDTINQLFDNITGAYTEVRLKNEFLDANSVFNIKLGTIDYNIIFKDDLSGNTLFTATPAESNTNFNFRWDINTSEYQYESPTVKISRRIQLTVLTNGQTTFTNVLVPAPFDQQTVKMIINGQPSYDFSISGGTTIIYGATEFVLETDDTVYVEYI